MVLKENLKFIPSDMERGKESKASIAKEYEIPPNTLSAWMKIRDKLKISNEKRAVDPQCKKLTYANVRWCCIFMNLN